MSTRDEGFRAYDDRLRAVERKADLNEERNTAREKEYQRLEKTLGDLSMKLWAVLFLVIGYVANQLLGLIGSGP